MINQDATQILFLDSKDSEIADLSQKVSPFGYQIIHCDSPDALAEAVSSFWAPYILVRIRRDQDNTALYQAAANATRPDYHPHILFICGDVSLESRILAVRSGGSAFIPAPYNAFDVVDRLESFGGTMRDEPYRVMIVDDDPLVNRYHNETLINAGFATKTLEKPGDLLSHLADFMPELILMDFYMPKIDGRELAAAIRQQPAYDSIPIVFLSAEDDPDLQQQVMGIGGDDFLTKPIRADHLINSISIRARRFRSLRSTMLRDSLTGLLNHTAIKEQTTIALSRMRRSQNEMVFALLDIDHFKSVNDTYGHPVGDQVLRSLSHLLKQRLRNTDIIGRYGGEEFAVALPDTSMADAIQVMDSIRESFSKIDHASDNGMFQVTFSCGLAGFPTYTDTEQLTEAADQALYRAKHAGRNRLACAEGE